MTITKKIIVKNLSKKLLISLNDSSRLMESFLEIIKKQSQIKNVKISGFGTFSFKNTPQRFGRNPKTKESYIITSRNRFNLKSSNKLKGELNWKA